MATQESATLPLASLSWASHPVQSELGPLFCVSSRPGHLIQPRFWAPWKPPTLSLGHSSAQLPYGHQQAQSCPSLPNTHLRGCYSPHEGCFSELSLLYPEQGHHQLKSRTPSSSPLYHSCQSQAAKLTTWQVEDHSIQV